MVARVTLPRPSTARVWARRARYGLRTWLGLGLGLGLGLANPNPNQVRRAHEVGAVETLYHLERPVGALEPDLG